MEQVRTILATVVFGPIPPGTLIPWAAPLFVLALLGAAPWPYLTRDHQAGSPSMDWLRCLLPLAWMLAPIVMIVVLGLFRGAYLKFLLIGSPAFSLLLARGVTGPVGWAMRAPVLNRTDGDRGSLREAVRDSIAVGWVIATLALVFAVSGALLARYWNEPTAARDDYRGISQFIAATGQPNDAVLLDAPGQSEVFGYYYDGDLPVYALPKQRPMDPAADHGGAQATAGAREGVCAVLGDGRGRP